MVSLWGRLRRAVRSSGRAADEARDEEEARRARSVSAIKDTKDRQKTLVFGTILSMTYPPDQGTSRVLVASLYDGTDSLELRWPGRSDIPGLRVGVHVEIEGTVGMRGPHRTIVNPLYRVIAGGR